MKASDSKSDCCSYQALAESDSAVTKLARHPLAPAQAACEVRRLLDADGVVKLAVHDSVVRLTMALARKRGLRGVAFFDAQIVGTMLSHGIGTPVHGQRR